MTCNTHVCARMSVFVYTCSYLYTYMYVHVLSCLVVSILEFMGAEGNRMRKSANTGKERGQKKGERGQKKVKQRERKEEGKEKREDRRG